MNFIRTAPMVDMHVHFREPGTNMAETIESGSRAAAAGGVGAAVDMSNNPGHPTLWLPDVQQKHGLARDEKAGSHIVFLAAAGMQPEYENTSGFRAIHPYVPFFKAYGGPTTNIVRPTDYEVWEFDENLDELAAIDPNTLIVFHSGKENYEDFIGHAAGDRGLRVHLTHVNNMGQVEAVNRAKKREWRVTSDVTVHHVTMNTNDLRTRSSFADMQPPLVEQVDSDRLMYAVAHEEVDAFATDHAPHTLANKMAAAVSNPACLEGDHGSRCCGLPTIDHAAPVLFWQAHANPERITMDRVVEAYSTVPARILGLSIRSDSFVEWDTQPYRISEEFVQVESDAGWSPFLGMMAMGRIREMRVAGKQIIADYQLNERVRAVATGRGEEI